VAIVFRRDPSDQSCLDASVRDCAFCGEKNAADGMWLTAQGPLGCCRSCATDNLSAFVADVLVGERGHQPGGIEKVQSALRRWEARFWRATALALVEAVGRERRMAEGRRARREAEAELNGFLDVFGAG
jgi:hypothetical protein